MRLMKIIAPGLMLLALGGCSSMLMGGGTSAGAPIGTDSRSVASQEKDDALSQSVLHAFARDAQLRDERLYVVARSGVVTLSGTVDAFETRDRAVTVASGTAGVARVDNQIAVDTRP